MEKSLAGAFFFSFQGVCDAMPQDFGGVMREFKGGKLHSGRSNGPVVKNPAQAKAIAVSEQKKLSGGAYGKGPRLSGKR